MKFLISVISLFFIFSCSNQQVETFPVKKIILDSTDTDYGYYLSVIPNTKKIKGVLVLFPGLSQQSESIFTASKLHEYATKNNLLTIGFSGKMRITADSLIQAKLNKVLEDVITRYQIKKDKFIFGGFSAGGVVALRYVELCHQFPEKFPVSPKAVFMADAPVDLFLLWKLKEEDIKNNLNKTSINEGLYIARLYHQFYGGTPSDNPDKFIDLSPFSIDPLLDNNEIYLKNVAIRAYHDVDISWRIKNRNQTARFDNYVGTSELINRLIILGNDQAHFIQSYQTGYRKDGKRHPHSWSIIDEKECIEWVMTILK